MGKRTPEQVNVHEAKTQLSRLLQRVEEGHEILQDPETDRILSMASVWEISIKFALGKLRLPESPDRYVPDRLALSMTRILPIELRHAVHVAQLPVHHRDPFDRMLVAQALIA